MSENFVIFQGFVIPPTVYWLSEILGVISPILSFFAILASLALLIFKHYDRWKDINNRDEP